MSGPHAHGESADTESQSLLHTMPHSVVRMSWTLVSVGLLVMTWCVLDSWNHDVNTQLNMIVVSGDSGNPQQFSFPLLLAFIQFLFMSILFFFGWLVFSSNPAGDIKEARTQIPKSHVLGLGLSHAVSIYGLQSMVLPKQMMGIGLFAATRAVEIPATSVMRNAIMDKNQLSGGRGGQSVTTAAAMFISAWILFYSYTQIAECLCVWSGHGVQLSGIALYLIYALVLIVPGANAVYQEAVMVKLESAPLLLMLLMQNVVACLFCIPLLGFAQMAGIENVGLGWSMLAGHREVQMSVVWMCVQVAALSVIYMGVIRLVGSFWAVSSHCLRVVYWWGSELIFFYMKSGVSLSIARPHASLWSFAMFFAILCAVVTFANDRSRIEPGKDISKQQTSYRST